MGLGFPASLPPLQTECPHGASASSPCCPEEISLLQQILLALAKPGGQLAVVEQTQQGTQPTVIALNPACWSFVLTNDGPKTLIVQLNTSSQLTLLSGERLPLDYGAPVLTQMIVRCAAVGDSAAYRLWASY